MGGCGLAARRGRECGDMRRRPPRSDDAGRRLVSWIAAKVTSPAGLGGLGGLGASGAQGLQTALALPGVPFLPALP